MPQPADAEYRNALTRLHACFLQRTEHGNASAKQWSGLNRRNTVRNSGDMTRGRKHELGVPAVHRHTCDFLIDAEILVSSAAVIARATGPVNPRKADAVA